MSRFARPLPWRLSR